MKIIIIIAVLLAVNFSYGQELTETNNNKKTDVVSNNNLDYYNYSVENVYKDNIFIQKGNDTSKRYRVMYMLFSKRSSEIVALVIRDRHQKNRNDDEIIYIIAGNIDMVELYPSKLYQFIEDIP